jgi:hypothetical protein
MEETDQVTESFKVTPEMVSYLVNLVQDLWDMTNSEIRQQVVLNNLCTHFKINNRHAWQVAFNAASKGLIKREPGASASVWITPVEIEKW